MEVAQTPPAAAASVASTEVPMETETPASTTEPTTETANESNAIRNRTLKDIISGMKKRRGAKPAPSSLQRAAERRKKRRRQSEGTPEEDTPTETVARIATPPPAAEPAQEEEKEDEVVAPQVTLDEDGNIVIDQASLVVSAGTTTNADMEAGEVTTVENHAYTNHITSATYSKRESAMKWGTEENEKFYAALRKFGTDFTLMESEFPKRSRRQLKLKFKREEKEFPQRIDEALNGPKLPLPPVKKTVPINNSENNDDEGATVIKEKENGKGGNGDISNREVDEGVEKVADLPTGDEEPTVVEEAPTGNEEPTVVEEAPIGNEEPTVVEDASQQMATENGQGEENNEADGEKDGDDGDDDDDDGDRWSDSDDSGER